MLNQIVMVGRIMSEPIIEKEKDGEEKCNIVLEIKSSRKNSKGEYETDIVKCNVSKNISGSIKEYCKKGDIVGIKGHIKSKENNELEIECDRLTFLTSKKENEIDTSSKESDELER